MHTPEDGTEPSKDIFQDLLDVIGTVTRKDIFAVTNEPSRSLRCRETIGSYRKSLTDGVQINTVKVNALEELRVAQLFVLLGPLEAFYIMLECLTHGLGLRNLEAQLTELDWNARHRLCVAARPGP